MTKRVLIPIANGSCEIQISGFMGCFARCGAKVVTACIDGDHERMVKTKLIKMQADMRFQEATKRQWDLIVLPGGAVGAYTMRDCTELIGMLAKQKADGKLVGASGAAPSIVLASMHGFLQEGATCFPLTAFRNTIPKASDTDVVVHDSVVTSQGTGSALAFALMLVELLYDSELADTVAQSMLVDRTKYRYFPPELDPMIRMMREEELEAQAVQEEELEAQAGKNGKSGKEKQKTPTKNPQAVKESNVATATSQKDSMQLSRQSLEAAATESRGGDLGNEHQESFVEDERLNDDSDCSGTSAGDEQTEENSVIDTLDSEATSSGDSRISDSSWDGEWTRDKRKHASSSNKVEPPPKRSVCFDVEESMLVDRTKYRYFPPELDPMIRMTKEEQLEAQAVQEEEFLEEQAGKNGKSGKEKQKTPTKNPQAVKESNVANETSQKDSMQLSRQSVEAAATETRGGELGNEHQESFVEGVKESNVANAASQKDSMQLAQQSVEAAATATRGGELGNEHQESFVEGERFNDDSYYSGTSAGDEQTEENSVIDTVDSEATSPRDSRVSDSSWDGEWTLDKRKHASSSNEVEPPPKRSVCFDVEEIPAGIADHGMTTGDYSIPTDEYYIMMMRDTMNHGGTNTTADTCNGMDHSGHTVIQKGSSDQLGGS